MGSSCVDGRAPQPGAVADSRSMAPKSDLLRTALGSLLRSKFDGELARGTRADLGEQLGTYTHEKSAAVKVDRLLAGKAFPDQQWEIVAEFVGATPAGLLRELANAVETEDERRTAESIVK